MLYCIRRRNESWLLLTSSFLMSNQFQPSTHEFKWIHQLTRLMPWCKSTVCVVEFLDLAWEFFLHWVQKTLFSQALFHQFWDPGSSPPSTLGLEPMVSCLFWCKVLGQWHLVAEVSWDIRAQQSCMIMTVWKIQVFMLQRGGQREEGGAWKP